MSKLGFNPSDYGDPQGAFEPVPDGQYFVMGTDAELKEASSGKGHFIKATFEISKGPFLGRKIFMNFNVIHSNETTQKIGREEMASWCRAAGKPNATDTDDVLNVEVLADVMTEKGNAGYKDSNRIRAFHDKNAKPADKTKDATAPAAGGKPAPAGNPPAGGKPAPAGKSTAKKNPWDDE